MKFFQNNRLSPVRVALPGVSISGCAAVVLYAAVALNPKGCDVEQLQQPSNSSPSSSTLGQQPNSSAESTPVTTQPVPSQVNLGGSQLNTQECDSLRTSAPRGLSCLHCSMDSASEQALEIISLLRESCLENVAINYLVDGTFGYNEETLYTHIHSLTTGGRHLFVEFYLTSGPAVRRREKDHEQGFGANLTPAQFREKIVGDYTFREAYKEHILRLLPVIKFAADRKASIAIVPMLEDNLDKESFLAMLELTKQAIPNELNIRYGRSACPRCAAGNDDSIPENVFRESHSLADAKRTRKGVITNDGSIDPFDRENLSSHSISYQLLLQSRRHAEKNDSVFILWSASRQGIYMNESGQTKRLLPSLRKYATPTAEEQKDILNFLRGDTLGTN